MAETRQQKLAREMSHLQSHEQLDPTYTMADLPEQYGGGRYARSNQELQAPMFDPMDPFMWPKTLPATMGKGALQAIAEAIHRGIQSGSPLLAPALPLNVVKQKGGNWLNGSVEDALRGLKRGDPAMDAILRQNFGMVDAPMFNELKGREGAINSWIEGPLTKYVKTRMATPDDEVRRLAEQGVLHTPLYNQVPIPAHFGVGYKRVNQGFPQEGMASSNLARQWEELSDRAIDASTAGSLRNPHNYLKEARRDKVIGGNHWLQSVPEESTVFDVRSRGRIDALGFPHLIDELRNALNPNSGLPQHLQLSPDAMKNLSMEKAVRRVSDINAWRAAQQVEANRKLAEQASVVREYAENNPKGLRWVELKRQEELPEGWILKPGEGEYAGYDWFFDPQGKAHNALNDPRNKMLADQLKYEGDTMGHCVGGYCDDVLSGRSRIFSLRDAKGEPHVTVEVAASPRNVGQQDIPDRYLDAAMDKLGITTPEAQFGREEEIDKLAGSLWKKDNPNTQRILQIKGSGKKTGSRQVLRLPENGYPNAEDADLLPFVQDFVRNSPLGQPWSDVGDLQNTGLRKGPFTHPISGEDIGLPQYMNTDEVRQALIDAGIPEQNVSGHLRQYGFASGGIVSKWLQSEA